MSLTPKEYGTKLLHMFYISLPNNGSFTGLNNINKRWEEGKMCALIAIEELIRVTPWCGDEDVEVENGSKEFYMKAKTEIEKL